MKKNIILIDANVYLRFYDSSGSKFRALLKTLVELKENIFITEQICSEVQRNKLSAAMNSFSANYKSLGIRKTSLPEHLDNNVDERLKQWNDSRNNIIKEEEILKKEYSQIVSKTLESIMESKDNVSKELATIFSLAQSASKDEFASARLRKELGNPPGKSDDPLGDQLTWEQLLTKYSDQEIWLITTDHDYLTEYSGKSYLNPYLFNELKIKSDSGPPKIHIFKSLTDGINDYIAKLGEKVDALPSNDELDVIRSEEEEIIRSTVVSSNITSIGYDNETSTLHVEFNGGSIYQYNDVPQNIYDKMLSSGSVGMYLIKNIKNAFSYSKIR
jgi:hypothetical protein